MKKSNMTWGIVAAAAGILALLRKKKAQPASGIGAVDWYHAVLVAVREMGIDFSKSYHEQPQNLMYDLAQFGKRLGYKNSTTHGYSYAFYQAVKRRMGLMDEMMKYEH